MFSNAFFSRLSLSLSLSLPASAASLFVLDLRRKESWPSERAAVVESRLFSPFQFRLFSLFSLSSSARPRVAIPTILLVPIPPRRSLQLPPATSAGAHRDHKRRLVAKNERKGGVEGDRRGGVTRFLKIQQSKKQRERERKTSFPPMPPPRASERAWREKEKNPRRRPLLQRPEFPTTHRKTVLENAMVTTSGRKDLRSEEKRSKREAEETRCE